VGEKDAVYMPPAHVDLIKPLKGAATCVENELLPTRFDEDARPIDQPDRCAGVALRGTIYLVNRSGCAVRGIDQNVCALRPPKRLARCGFS